MEQAKDLEQALMLNKDILKLAFETSKQPPNNSNSTNDTSNEQQINKTLMQKLHDENVQLTKQLKKMNEERNIAQNKVRFFVLYFLGAFAELDC